jgi:hypothetical protein
MKRENRRGLVPIMGMTKLAKLRGRQIPFFFFYEEEVRYHRYGENRGSAGKSHSLLATGIKLQM